MNVLQVLAITTVGYFAVVALWVTKMEDLLMTREDRRARDSLAAATPDSSGTVAGTTAESESGSGSDTGSERRRGGSR